MTLGYVTDNLTEGTQQATKSSSKQQQVTLCHFNKSQCFGGSNPFQNLMYCQLYDLPAERQATKKGRSHDPDLLY